MAITTSSSSSVNPPRLVLFPSPSMAAPPLGGRRGPSGTNVPAHLRLLSPEAGVPDLDLSPARVAAGRGQAPSVGAEGQAADNAGVAAQRDRLGRRGRLQVPDLHGRVPA